MRVAVLSDIHFPDHDVSAWKLTKKLLGDLNLDLIYLLGDIFDFEPVTRFMVKPEIYTKLQEHIDIGVDALSSLRDFYQGKIKFLSGNHEYRLKKFLYTDAKRLSSLRSLELPNLLELKSLDIEYFDNEYIKYDKIGKLYFCHGDENKISSSNAAKNLYTRLQENVITGHHHKFDAYYFRNLSGLLYQSHVNACLQNLDPDWAGFAQWDQGFSVIDFTSAGYFKVDQLRFFKTKNKMMCMYPTTPGQSLITT